MEVRSSQRIAKKRGREQEVQAEEAANILMNIKDEKLDTFQHPIFSFRRSDVDPMDSLTPLLISIYGEDTINKWKESGNSLRKIWELSPPQIQCKNSIGKPESCWICGGGFNESIVGLKSICEHVLPIAQSVFFLGLYASSKKKHSYIDKEDKKLFELEYEWAHSICNNVKSSLIFIVPMQSSSGTVSGMKVDTRMVTLFLKKLSKASSSQEGIEYIHSQLSTPEAIDARVISITTRLEKITTFLNDPILRGENALQLLAQTSSYVNPETVHPKFEQILTNGGRKTFKHRHNGKSVRKSTTKNHRSNSRTYRKIRTSIRKRS